MCLLFSMCLPKRHRHQPEGFVRVWSFSRPTHNLTGQPLYTSICLLFGFNAPRKLHRFRFINQSKSDALPTRRSCVCKCFEWKFNRKWNGICVGGGVREGCVFRCLWTSSGCAPPLIEPHAGMRGEQCWSFNLKCWCVFKCEHSDVEVNFAWI